MGKYVTLFKASEFLIANLYFTIPPKFLFRNLHKIDKKLEGSI